MCVDKPQRQWSTAGAAINKLNQVVSRNAVDRRAEPGTLHGYQQQTSAATTHARTTASVILTAND